MHRNGVGEVEFRQQFRRVARDAVVVERERDDLRGRIDRGDRGGIAVENAEGTLARVGTLADNVVVIAHLHHAVPHAQDALAHTQLGLARRGGLSASCKRRFS